jgi:hypothetical protein
MGLGRVWTAQREYFTEVTPLVTLEPLLVGVKTEPSPKVGDVPLFVEHCEAVAAEVDVTLR